jgi:hypothetical protein
MAACASRFILPANGLAGATQAGRSGPEPAPVPALPDCTHNSGTGECVSAHP